MKRIFVFSEVYHDFAIEYNELTAGVLAEIIAGMVGDGHKVDIIESMLADFLAENDHIHLDAFINVCLEGIV
ncbi:MAG: hypothetical protein FWC93_05495 [Defluviitaleaceae bacterium]|nr:hypothetical protein [Defluviitaleaceae bacterium]